MDLKELQRVEISQVQQNRVEIADFPEEYKIKQVGIIGFNQHMSIFFSRRPRFFMTQTFITIIEVIPALK
jgi:hypothetical protein